MLVSHEVILRVRDALKHGRRLAYAEHERHMEAGKYDSDAHHVALDADAAAIAFKVWVLDKLPAVELESVAECIEGMRAAS